MQLYAAGWSLVLMLGHSEFEMHKKVVQIHVNGFTHTQG
jgi:hypothetical protein